MQEIACSITARRKHEPIEATQRRQIDSDAQIEISVQEGEAACSFFRAAFKFGRREHFALRHKTLKPPIAHLPSI